MSFILDALKKSETERQQQGSAEFSSVPASSGGPSPARWLWMLAALLGVNLAVLIGILMRPDTETAATGPAVPEQAAARSASDAPPNFAEQIAEVAVNRAATTPPSSPPVTVQEPDPAPTSGSTPISVPTIDQLRLDGTLDLAELHLDIHVYSEQPEERFVFINMVKQRERSRLPEGPTVREITSAGVILEYQGQAFLLPRE